MGIGVGEGKGVDRWRGTCQDTQSQAGSKISFQAYILMEERWHA